MKKILLSLSCVLLLAFSGIAQRYAVVDSKYILDKIPDYKEAQKKLDIVVAEKNQNSKIAEPDKNANQ